MSRNFFFNDTATPEIYTLSLHDALPISPRAVRKAVAGAPIAALRSSSRDQTSSAPTSRPTLDSSRSEEHTSELQSPCNLVCRLLLEKKKIIKILSTKPTALPLVNTSPSK